MKKRILLPLLAVLLLGGCGVPGKEITVVVREAGSGTREAFDRAIGDGVHFLEEYDESGKRIDRVSVYAVIQTKGGSVLSAVAADRHAIGYLSPSALNEGVRAVAVDGVLPTPGAVLDGSYPLRRPFSVMHSAEVEPTPLAADFLRYLQSREMARHASAAGCVFALPDAPEFEPLDALPAGERLLLRGSTSLERLITAAARDYAALYHADPTALFEIGLEGSSIGGRAAREDRSGRVIGLSSAEVNDPRLSVVTVAYDALAVIVHPKNPIRGLSRAELFGVFSGKIRRFEELTGGGA